MADETKDETPKPLTDDQKVVDGQSFYAEHLTGSGTILPGGTYGPPQPDPTVQRGGPEGVHTSPGGVDREAQAEPVKAPTQRTTQTAKRSNQK